jgi:hypothetical protein
MPAPATTDAARSWRWVLVAGAGIFALMLGARQSIGLFPGELNTSTAGLIFALGASAGGGAGMAGPWVGQFVFAPLAQAVTSASGWVAAVQTLGLLTLRSLIDAVRALAIVLFLLAVAAALIRLPIKEHRAESLSPLQTGTV